MLLFFLASGAALGALLGRSWPPGALLALLGPCLALPGRSWEPFSSPRGLLWDLFGSLFLTPLEKHENLDFRRQLQRKSRFGRPRGVQNQPQMAPKSLLGASWPLFSRLVACCCRSWLLLVRPGALRARFLRVWERSREVLRPTWHCYLRFYAVCALALSQCSECSKTTVLIGRNTLRKHGAPRPKSQKIAGRAFRNQQPT